MGILKESFICIFYEEMARLNSKRDLCSHIQASLVIIPIKYHRITNILYGSLIKKFKFWLYNFRY